jgi:hypothetical protein
MEAQIGKKNESMIYENSDSEILKMQRAKNEFQLIDQQAAKTHIQIIFFQQMYNLMTA